MRFLMLAVLTLASACAAAPQDPEPAPRPLASDEVAFRILQAATTVAWNPRNQSGASGLLCIPALEFEYGRLQEDRSREGDHQGHSARWASTPQIVIAKLQEHADLLYSESDQSSGKLLYRNDPSGLESMRKLVYWRPVLFDSGNSATVWVNVSTGYFSSEERCCHLILQDDGEWVLEKVHLTGIVN